MVLKHPPPAQVVFSNTALQAQQHRTVTNIKKISIRTLALACKPGNKRVEGQSTCTCVTRVRSACAPGVNDAAAVPRVS